MRNGLLPGLNTSRLIQLMKASTDRCRMNLEGLEVLTEAASGAYVVTPILAALAGARRVFAVTKKTRHGTVEEIGSDTMGLARAAGVADRIEIVAESAPHILGTVDIVTNSGHVRPIDARMIAQLKATAAIPLMYEAWEFRESDVDLAACRQRGIAVAGTNERHPAIDVFSFLGIMAVKLLLDAGISVYGTNILVVSDNPFAPYIQRGLEAAGAIVEVVERLDEISRRDRVGGVDAVLLAARPGRNRPLGQEEARRLAEYWPGAVLAQFWGNVDREAFAASGVPCWPDAAPAFGHMGILPSSVGPEPIVRLQAGGLKVGEVLVRAHSGNREGWEYVDEL